MDASGDHVQQLVAVGVHLTVERGIGGQHRRPHPVAVGGGGGPPDRSSSEALRSACTATSAWERSKGSAVPWLSTRLAGRAAALRGRH